MVKLIGNERVFRPEHRALNAVLLSMAAITAVGSLTKFLFGVLGAPFLMVTIVIFSAAMYHFSRFLKKFDFVWKAYAILSFLFLGLIFFARGGIDGTMVLIFIVVLTSLLAVTPLQTHNVWVTGHLVVFVVLLLFERAIDMNVPVALNSPTSVLIDNVMTYTLMVTVVAVTVFRLRLGASQKEIEETSTELKIEKKANHALQLEKDGLNRLIQTLSHDVSSPLHSTQNYLTLLDRTDLPESEEIELRQKLKSLTASTTRMVEQLLTWLQLQSGKWEPRVEQLRISEVLQEPLALMEQIAALKQVRLELSITHDLVFYSDPMIIQAIARNMIHNAIKFSPPNSKVQVSCTQVKRELVIAVIDEGRGMSTKEQDDLRKGLCKSQYGSSGEKGWGLGMQIMSKSAELIGAELQLESEHGRGTRITLRIPFQKKVHST